jgi:hypothetical protein
MKRYVTVQDLIRNGGEGCSLLRKEPHNEDHIIIEIDDYNVDHPDDPRSMSITHYNMETHVTKCLVLQVITGDNSIIAVDDLNNARMMLFRYKMCRRCTYFQQYLKTSQYNICWHCGDNDNWDNYKTGKCPNKLLGCEEYIVKVTYTNEGRIFILMNGSKELLRSLPNESYKDFSNSIDFLSCLS